MEGWERTHKVSDCKTTEYTKGTSLLSRRVTTGTSSSGDQYYIKNHLGSTMLLTSASGDDIIASFDYFPYGKKMELAVTSEHDVTQTFTGKEQDRYDDDMSTGEDGEGWYYFGARYYDPELCIFTSTDPAEEFWNSYSYTGGNPVNLVDPSGLSTCVDETGNVTEVRNDGDLNVYTWTQESGNDIANGKTDFWNEFKASDFINIGMSVDATIAKMQYMYVVGKNAIEVALESKGGGVLDVKTQGLSPKEGYLYQGSYMTGRSVGNRLAGINAAALGMPWWLSNFAAGALHLKENGLRDLGKPSPYGNTLKYMGEIEYTGRQYQMGYNSVRK